MSNNKKFKPELHSSAFQYQNIDSDPYDHQTPKLFIEGKDIERRYMPSQKKSALHAGQLKLLMNELVFFLYTINDPKKVYRVLYVGAAPGRHIQLHLAIFPNIKFILVDPAKFDPEIIKYSKNHQERVKIINDYFTDDSAKLMVKDINKWKEDGEIFLFISDIRVEPTEDRVEKDMDWQQKWIEIMKPDYSLLKFRLSWENKDKEYLKGVVIRQQYPPKTSTETRLFVDSKDKNEKIKWNATKYEDQLFYHNSVYRLKYFKWAEKYDESIIKKTNGMDHCYDCASTLYITELIYNKYSKLYGSSFPYKSIPELFQNCLKLSFEKNHNLFTWYVRQYSSEYKQIIQNLSERFDPIFQMYKKEKNYQNKKNITQSLKNPIYEMQKIIDKYYDLNKSNYNKYKN